MAITVELSPPEEASAEPERRRSPVTKLVADRTGLNSIGRGSDVWR